MGFVCAACGTPNSAFTLEWDKKVKFHDHWSAYVCEDCHREGYRHRASLKRQIFDASDPVTGGDSLQNIIDYIKELPGAKQRRAVNRLKGHL